MNTDTEFLASVPQRMPEWDAEILETFYRGARVSQHVNPHVAALRSAFYLGDDGRQRTHERDNGQRNKAIARGAIFRKRIVVGPHAVELEFRVVIEKSSARTVGKQNLPIDPIAIQSFEALRGLIDRARHFLPTLRIVAAFIHRRRAIADIPTLNLAIDDPALDRIGKFLIPHFDDMRNPVSPLLLGHASRIGVFAELSVRIRAD